VVYLRLIPIVYVKHTKQLVEQSSNCYLGIENLDLPKVCGCQIDIMNYGLGNAVNIEIFVEMASLVKILECEQDRIQMIAATGPKALPVGKMGKYEINNTNYVIQEDTDILIHYTTQTGNEFIYKWNYSPDKGAFYLGAEERLIILTSTKPFLLLTPILLWPA